VNRIGWGPQVPGAQILWKTLWIIGGNSAPGSGKAAWNGSTTPKWCGKPSSGTTVSWCGLHDGTLHL